MPNRIIREGWLESDKVDSLDASAERFFLRLCLRADDFGRFHGNPILLKSSLFPLKEDVRSTDIPRWIAACEKAGLVRCYEAESKRFVLIEKFDQRMRAEKSKFPCPDCLKSDCRCHAADIRTVKSDAESKTKVEVECEPLPFPSEEFAEAWNEWMSFRSERKKPLTSRSISQSFRSFEEWGELGSIKSIQESIRNGWQGLFEPKQKLGLHPAPSIQVNIPLSEREK